MNVWCVVSTLLVNFVHANDVPPPCDSDIYCHGPLLHSVQMSNIHPDSKTFVDMKMKYSRDEIWQKFSTLMNRTNNTPNNTEISKFVNETFDPPGSEFEDWNPVDWRESPKFLNKIKDIEFKFWAKHLHGFWKSLGRKMKDEVKHNMELYSIIYIPHPVIVPGGRFREVYYWDSYWIVRGLLISEMHQTVKGVLENFLYLVKRYGFIPNGGRIYYTKRSQPPFLIPMVKSYVDKTNDTDFLRQNIDTLEKEFLYWMKNRTVEITKDGKTFKLARYSAPSLGPRPESYSEDFESAKVFQDDFEKQEFYNQLKSAAESGWDFSTRWFILNGTNSGNLSNTKTQYIIPVELNALLYWSAKLLSQFYDTLGQAFESVTYAHIANEILQAVNEVLWNENVGIWLDYDLINNKSRNYFYPTNLVPLWTGCYDKRMEVGRIMKYLERSQIMMHMGGIPTSLEHSGEQWDFPNAWPPLQYMVIMSLEATEDKWAQELAFEIAKKWVRSNYKAFNESKAMYEKYDATLPGGHGTGGEYVNQIGFGWTNGIILELLEKYGQIMTIQESFFHPETKHIPDSAAIRLSVVTYIPVMLTLVSCAVSFL